jgi:hypothetical protein
MSALLRRAIGAAAASAAIVAATAVPATAATSHHAGREYFLITVADQHETVVAHGAFVGAGKDVEHDQSDTLHLGGGTLEIYHPDRQSTFSFTVNPKTCFLSFTITGKYTLGAGTGKYAGITGHGNYVVKEQGIARRTKAGACNVNVEPAHIAGYIKASGPAYRS